MFGSSGAITTIPDLDYSLGTNFYNIFYRTSVLTNAPLNGLRYSVDLTDTQITRSSIIELFDKVGTADGAQTIKLTGVPGVSELEVSDFSTVLGKGWTIEPNILCFDGITNQDESDADCGGSTCGMLCANTKICTQALDCLSGTCDQGLCVSCDDGIQNQDETGIDIGGVCSMETYDYDQLSKYPQAYAWGISAEFNL